MSAGNVERSSWITNFNKKEEEEKGSGAIIKWNEFACLSSTTLSPG